MEATRRLGRRVPIAWHWLSSGRTFSSTTGDLSLLPPPALGKLLVANRGEIACRIFTTAKRLGVPTVAVFSEADRGAAHVQLADEAFYIGQAPARESYLRSDRILEAAISSGATAIHPGYGFLSENSGFAAACEAAGVSFVGPPAAAIEAMGDKSRAKATMAAAGVPVVPGYHGEGQDEAFLEEEAHKVGFPLLVKAVMGGGGKGMKLAQRPEEFLDALYSARREAAASFGDDRVLLERFVVAPRHIEVQVMADSHGNAFYLAERDCSVQRRHQKVIEEAPAPGVDRAFRAALGGSAVDAARAVGYRNAGTVEFIVDSKTGDYYFMEMNTRLQVEHPVTEAVVGLDLVELQLRVAAGDSLAGVLHQEALEPQGHAFEARLYAENPFNNFLPAGGKVLRWKPPSGSTFFTFSNTSASVGAPTADADAADINALPGGQGCAVRVDSGVREGDVVGVNYDPMIAKVVVKGPDRATALKGLRDALGTLQVAGMPTNAEFVRRVALNEEFRKGGVDTSFISRHEEELLAPQELNSAAAALAVAAYVGIDSAGAGTGTSEALLGVLGRSLGPWALADSFRLNHQHEVGVVFAHAGSGKEVEAVVQHDGDGNLSVSGQVLTGEGGHGHSVRVSAVQMGRDSLTAEVAGQIYRASWSRYTHGEEEVLDLWIQGGAAQGHHQFRRHVIRRWRQNGSAAAATGTVSSPMPGRIVKVFVGQGDEVNEGDRVCVVEAMKMEHAVKAPCSGIVEELHAFEGAQVEDGQILAVVVPEEALAAIA